jgi:hypothetical protein
VEIAVKTADLYQNILLKNDNKVFYEKCSCGIPLVEKGATV